MAEAQPLTLTLSKPVQAHGEDVTTLTFREPTGADIAKAGMPVSFGLSDGEAQVTFNPKEMNAMLACLAGVPPSTIGQLAAGDWTAAAYMVTPFFVPAGQTSSSSPPTD